MKPQEKSKIGYDESQFDEPAPPVLTRRYVAMIIAGSVLYGILMLVLFQKLAYSARGDVATAAFLVFVPFGIGVLSTFAIPSDRRSIGNVTLVAILTTIIFMVTAGIIFSGLWLCLLMIAPFVIVIGVIGALVIKAFAWLWQRGAGKAEKKKRQYVFAGFLVLLPLLVTPIESSVTPPDWMRQITDSVIIAGTPETVWNNIIRMDTISPDEQRPSFYHTMGIPRPIRATLDKEALGGIRQGEFEFGLKFYETITVWQPNEAVRFTVDVHQNPQSSPVLMQIGGKYFDITEAGYQIEVVDAEHVRLTLNSTYRLSTNFNFYGAFWSDWIMHDFQSYVLQTVKTRVEKS
jgi:hypothetical protein